MNKDIYYNGIYGRALGDEFAISLANRKTLLVTNQAINLGIFLMSKLQNNQVDMITAVIKKAKVPIHPSSMGITYQDLERTLYACNKYVIENSYSYSILHEKPITSVEVDLALHMLQKEFDPSFSSP